MAKTFIVINSVLFIKYIVALHDVNVILSNFRTEIVLGISQPEFLG